MQEYYLIQGFDTTTSKKFVVHPSLYKTKREAEKYIAAHTTRTLSFGYKRVFVGEID